MATVDWAAIENPALNRGKRQFDGGNLRFFYHWIDDSTKRKPDGTFEQKQIEMVMVSFPGENGGTPVKVDDRIKSEYAIEYKLWKEGSPVPLSGTPLSAWSACPRASVEELERFGFLTLEQLAESNDEAKRKLGPLSQWVKKAKEFQKASSSTQAQVAALSEQLEREKEKSARYEEQITLLMKRIEISGV